MQSAANHIQDAETCLVQGNGFLSERDFKSALEAYNRCLSLAPGMVEAHYNSGVVHHLTGELDKAISCYQTAIGLFPDMTEAHFNLGHALADLYQFQKAAAAFRQVLHLEPGHAKAAYSLGNLYKTMGENKQATQFYMLALRTEPDYAEAWNNLGVVHRDRDQLDQATVCFEQALAIDSKMAQAWFNLGIIRHKENDHKASLSYFEKAMTVNPDFAPAHWHHALLLPMLYRCPEEVDTSRQRYEDRLNKLVERVGLETEEQRTFARDGIASLTNFYLQYQGANDTDLQICYGQFAAAIMAANFPRWSKVKSMPSINRGNRLRIGYISSLVYGHTIGIFLSGWIKHHNRHRFELFCYHVGAKTDALTEHVSKDVDHFHHIPGSLDAAARQIDNDALHVLIHTDVGMNPITFQLAALRLAPIQCKGWGHPVTTGLPTMDYYLSSELMEPPDGDAHYSETLVRLPNLALCHDPPAEQNSTVEKDRFNIPDDRFVYLCAQSLFKYLPQHDDLYPRIALLAPKALFVFIAHDIDRVTTFFKNRLKNSFSQFGMKMEDYCHFVPKQLHAGFLDLNRCANIALDSLMWSGGKSSMEALWCGTPVITLPGNMMRGRHTYAFLKRIGAEQAIATDKEDYIRIAAHCATNEEFLDVLTSAVKAGRNLLYNDKEVIIALEDFLECLIQTGKAQHKALPPTISPENSCTPCLKVKSHRQNVKNQSVDGRHLSAGTALKLNPHYQEAYYNLGRLDLLRGDFKKARDLYRHCVEINPEHAAAYNNLGKALSGLTLWDQAKACYKRASQLNPTLGEAWFNLAEIQVRAKDPDGAIHFYKKAIEVQRDPSAAWNNLGNLYRKLGNYQQAAACYEKVVALIPDLAEAHYNLGSVLRLMESYESALRHLAQAVRLKPNYAEAWNNLALACKNIGEFDRALDCFDKAVECQPNLAVARWNRSFIYLLRKDYIKGWNDFIFRFRMPNWKSIYPLRPMSPCWDGTPCRHHTILVHDEQGLGDTLQFIRYLPMVKARCGRTILETRPELVSLLQSAHGIDQIVVRPKKEKEQAACDYHVPLLSLPGIFRTTAETIPAKVPYLNADPVKCHDWSTRLPEGKMRIGLVWAGRPQHTNDQNRSCPLSEMLPILTIPWARFVSLQKGTAASQLQELPPHCQIEDLCDQLDDFSDTAAVVANLDLVISVDTAVAHLAGALGKPVWVLIPFIADWRWGASGQDSPWYPNMRLFRQPRPKDWPAVMAAIRQNLNDLPGFSVPSSPTAGTGASHSGLLVKE